MQGRSIIVLFVKSSKVRWTEYVTRGRNEKVIENFVRKHEREIPFVWHMCTSRWEDNETKTLEITTPLTFLTVFKIKSHTIQNMTLHKIIKFCTDCFSVCQNITSKFRNIAIFKSFVNSIMTKNCRYVPDFSLY
jgi:hypothetical protein